MKTEKHVAWKILLHATYWAEHIECAAAFSLTISKLLLVDYFDKNSIGSAVVGY